MDDLSDEEKWFNERSAGAQPLEPDDWMLQIVAGFSADLPSGYEVRCEPDAEWGLRLVALRAGDPCGEVFLNRDSLDRPIHDQPAIGWKLRELQGELIEHEFGCAWPRCPVHGSHPLHANSDGWHCPTTAAADVRYPDAQRWEYGSLAQVPVSPEPPRADGAVRWYLDDLGWGVIAHHQGDLFVHFSSIIGEGYRNLEEGQL